MNRARLLWLVALAVILSVGLQAFPLPAPLQTGHLLGKGLPAGSPPVPLTDELYALGWSPRGDFAVLERRTAVGGQTVVRFRVIDLVDDKVRFQEEWPDWGAPEAQSAWWANREAEVDAVFTRFGLVPSDWQLGEFPLIDDEDFVSVLLRLGRGPDPLWINRLEIVVHSGRGLKVVGDSQGYWRWARLLGFVPSPFESRLAVVLLVQPAGWDGANQPLRFLISGLSLRAGFPKP